MQRRTFLKLTGGSVVGGAAAGCLAGGGPAGDTGPITIGALEPLSGPFAPWSTPHLAGLRFAIDAINADGGVLAGRSLELTVSDTEGDPAQADSAFRRQVERAGAVATTGAVSSDVGIRLAQTTEALGVSHLLHMAGSDAVIDATTRHVFRVGLLPATRYIQAMADAFGDADYDSVGAIVADYAWGHSVRAAIERHFDVDVAIAVAPYRASDFRAYLRQFDDDLEMLIASGHPPGVTAIANQAFELGYAPEVITGSNTPPQHLIESLSRAALGGYVHIHLSDPTRPAFAAIAERFAAAHDATFNTHTAYGYVTGRLLAAAIDRAGETDPAAIADAVRNSRFETLFAEPIRYSPYGELDGARVIYSRLLARAPPFDPDGRYHYEEVSRSAPLPALPPEQ